MAGIKGNRRTLYTKQSIRDSLLKLLQDHDIHKITVTDICKEANINRGTFYAHYEDPYQLLQCIEDELFEKLVEYLTEASELENKLTVMVKIFELAKDNKDLVKLLVFNQGDNRILQRILYILTQQDIIQGQANLGDISPTYLNYLTRFAVNGAVGVIQAWLENDLKEDPSEIAQIVTDISTSIFNCPMH